MKKLIVLLLLSIPALAQTGAYTGSPVINGVGQPIASASVAISTTNPCGTSPTYTFCNGQPQGIYTGTTPPGDLATIYLDTVVTTTIPNPILTDPLGNWTVYAPAGVYWATIYGYQIVPQVEAIQIGGGGGGIPFACASAVNGSIVGMTSTTTSSCDPNGITDFIGHWTSQSYRATGAFNGVVELTGGLADPTTVPDTNSFAFLAPLTVPTPYYFRPPASIGTVGQCWGLQSQVVGTNGTIDNAGWQNCVASAGTVEFQTNGVDNLNCTAGACPLQNLIPGANCTITNTSAGNVVINCTAAAAPQASNPTAPTAVVNGTPATTDYKYVIVGCEDGPTCAYHSAATSATDVPTGAATITSVNSITLKTYADTLYGYRCYNVYRTASGGTPSTTGLIANCIWKTFIDTGLAGDSTTPPATNTTVLDANGLTAPLPGCNKIPSAPWGIDGPPCSPNALDDEFTWGNVTWSPGDANNPFWTRIGTWTNATATLTNGAVIISQTTGSTNWACLMQPVPGSTPYAFRGYFNPNLLAANNNNGAGMGFYEQSSTKLIILENVSALNTMAIGKWTLPATFGSFTNSLSNFPYSTFMYAELSNNGTNITYKSSPNGVDYVTYFTEAKATFFTSGPSHVGYCVESSTGAVNLDVDYFRRTQ